MKWTIHSGIIVVCLFALASLAMYFGVQSGANTALLFAIISPALVAGIFSFFFVYKHTRWAKRRSRFWRKFGQRASRSANRFIVERMLEMRRPLQGIAGIHDLYDSTNSAKEDSGYLEIAHFCSKHLLNQLERTQFYCDLELNTAQIERNSFLLKDCLEKAVASASEQARINNVSVQLDLNPQVPRFVFGPEKYLSKVLIELIVNSIRYSSSRTVVTVSVDLDTNDPQKIVFTVKDCGMGIEPKRLHDIRSLDSSRKKMHVPWEGASLGIGISLVKSILKRFNGTISFESKIGQGTTVQLSFPVLELHGTEAPKQKTDSIASNLKVLVVDDEQVTRQVLLAYFDRLKVTADYAETGEAAISKAQNQAYDFIIMDLIMPGMGGYAASEKILSSCPHSIKPKIIVVSSSCRPEDYERAKATGIAKFLEKPVRFEQLKSTLIELSLESPTSAPSRNDNLKPLTEKLAPQTKKEKFYREGGYYVDFNSLYNSQSENLSQCQLLLYEASRNLSTALEDLALTMKNEDYGQAERILKHAVSSLKSVYCLHGFEYITDFQAKLQGRAPLEQIEMAFDSVCEFIENFCDEIDHLLPDQITPTDQGAA